MIRWFRNVVVPIVKRGGPGLDDRRWARPFAFRFIKQHFNFLERLHCGGRRSDHFPEMRPALL
jgi:hypothetical protein